MCLLFLALVRMYSPLRSVWAKERSSDWWERIVWKLLSAYDWLENFRMSRETFTYVCNEERDHIAKKVQLCESSVEKRVAVTLWYLSNGSDFRTIGHLFGISKATVCLFVKVVCQAIVKVLLSKYVKWPKGDALSDTVGFERKWGFPQCAGAIDGTHILIITPVYCPADCYNRKGWH